MRIAVQIPRTLREFAHLADDICVGGSTVLAALLELKQTYPALYASVCQETGAVRPHIHLFVNSNWVDTTDPIGISAPLHPGDILTIWTAVSGG